MNTSETTSSIGSSKTICSGTCILGKQMTKDGKNRAMKYFIGYGWKFFTLSRKMGRMNVPNGFQATNERLGVTYKNNTTLEAMFNEIYDKHEEQEGYR